MNEDPQAHQERKIRNLQAVARHMADRKPEVESEKPSRFKKKLSTLGPIGVGILFILGKGKFLLPLLKFTKLSTLVTMLAAVWVYAMFWGLPFAIGFVLLIYIHEMGHAVALHRMGINAGAPIFIPFVGAMISMKSLPRDAFVEAIVGIGGPLLGSAGALVCLVLGWFTGSLFWYALASTGFLINLFNMIPISPLDGGRIVGVIGRWLWVVGYAIGITVYFYTYSPILLLILFLGLFNLKRILKEPSKDYYRVESSKRITMGIAYFLLLGLLTLGMWSAEKPLEKWHAETAVQEQYSENNETIQMAIN